MEMIPFKNKVHKNEEFLLPFERIKRKILIKKDEPTSDKFGEYPEKRSAESLMAAGIVNIDKPSGPTSHQVSSYARTILGVKKAGHSGTLDPKVTGVLPVAIGGSTRIVNELLSAGKEYICLMKLHQDTDEGKLNNIIAEMTGKIKQLPPVKSAVKRQWRFRKVYYAKILAKKEREVLFVIGCEAGTYIRKWVHDLGEKIGGAHMIQLRRTKAGPFDESTLITLQDLTDAVHYCRNEGKEERIKKMIMPVERAVEHMPKIWVFDSTVDSLCHGANLNMPGIAKLESEIEIEQAVAVMTLKNELVCIGRAKENSDAILKKDHGLAATTDRVFMQPGTYPKVQARKR